MFSSKDDEHFLLSGVKLAAGRGWEALFLPPGMFQTVCKPPFSTKILEKFSEIRSYQPPPWKTCSCNALYICPVPKLAVKSTKKICKHTWSKITGTRQTPYFCLRQRLFFSSIHSLLFSERKWNLHRGKPSLTILMLQTMYSHTMAWCVEKKFHDSRTPSRFHI